MVPNDRKTPAQDLDDALQRMGSDSVAADWDAWVAAPGMGAQGKLDALNS
jgi:hypothetical protein